MINKEKRRELTKLRIRLLKQQFIYLKKFHSPSIRFDYGFKIAITKQLIKEVREK